MLRPTQLDQAGNDNYLEGLAKATGNRYGSQGFGAPALTSPIKVTNGVL
jgi:hypothetical protein